MDKWLYTMIKMAVLSASPFLVEGIRIAVAEMVRKGKQTVNPWDDALAGFLQMIVGKPSESPGVPPPVK